MNESRNGQYDYRNHRHLSGLARYRGKSIRYRPGQLSRWLLEKKKFPKRTNVRIWCDIILEIFERRATCTAYPYLWVPDDIWFSVIRYLDTIVNLQKHGVIDLKAVARRVRPEAFYERIGHGLPDPVFYRSGDKKLLMRGIDALLINGNELSGKVEYFVPFSPYRVVLTYRPGSLVRLFAREGRFENGILEFVECIAEMKERMEKDINGPFVRVTRKMDDLFRRFIQFGAVYARNGEIDSKDSRLISEFRRHLHRAEKKAQSAAIDDLLKDLQQPSTGDRSTGARRDQVGERELDLQYGPGAGSVEDRAGMIIASLRAEASRRKSVSRPIVSYVGNIDLYADTDPVERMEADSTREDVTLPERSSLRSEYETITEFSFDLPDRDLGEDLQAAFESRGPAVGDHVGSGVIKRRLSSDGIATVYQTRIPINAVDRVVKVYNVLVVPVDQREALAYHVLGELQKASRVRHPGIVEVHEIGMWNTFPYVETAFIEGADLDELLIRSGPLPANVACAVAVLICEALRFAHTSSVRHRGRNYAGVIHGDLKPTNVMISSDGRLRLLNFGTFGVFHEEAHIAGGGPDGSLRYCGFERLISGPVDGRTDLFSVGTVLYEMLTGQKAYEGKDVAAVMRARKTNTFRPITQAAPEVPGDLAEVVEQCMKRDPDDRPADVAEVLEFLTYAFGNLSEEHPATVVEEWFRSAYRPRRRPFERAVRQCAINPGFSNRSL